MVAIIKRVPTEKQRKRKFNKIPRSAILVLFLFCTESPKGATDLAKKCATFPWGGKLEAFTLSIIEHIYLMIQEMIYWKLSNISIYIYISSNDNVFQQSIKIFINYSNTHEPADFWRACAIFLICMLIRYVFNLYNLQIPSFLFFLHVG